LRELESRSDADFIFAMFSPSLPPPSLSLSLSLSLCSSLSFFARFSSRATHYHVSLAAGFVNEARTMRTYVARNSVIHSVVRARSPTIFMVGAVHPTQHRNELRVKRRREEARDISLSISVPRDTFLAPCCRCFVPAPLNCIHRAILQISLSLSLSLSLSFSPSPSRNHPLTDGSLINSQDEKAHFQDNVDQRSSDLTWQIFHDESREGERSSIANRRASGLFLLGDPLYDRHRSIK
jgi:hypothetical protein